MYVQYILYTEVSYGYSLWLKVIDRPIIVTIFLFEVFFFLYFFSSFFGVFFLSSSSFSSSDDDDTCHDNPIINT